MKTIKLAYIGVALYLYVHMCLGIVLPHVHHLPFHN